MDDNYSASTAHNNNLAVDSFHLCEVVYTLRFMEFKKALIYFGIGVTSVVLGGLILQKINEWRVSPPPLGKTN